MNEFTPEQIRWIFTAMFVLIASIALHEFGHALVAHLLGDDTPKRQGRLTLNPIAHADPIGTLALPILGLLFTQGRSTGFGWGKPVQWQPRNATRRWSMRTSEALVAIAGPGMNLILGTIVAIVHTALLAGGVLALDHPVNRALFYATGLNYTLMLFNLIPAPPLDGGWVAQRFIPAKHQRAWEKFSVYGPFIIMAFVMISPLAKIFTVPAEAMMRGIYNLSCTVFGMSPLFGT
jgi:Zn-dependent protease